MRAVLTLICAAGLFLGGASAIEKKKAPDFSSMNAAMPLMGGVGGSMAAGAYQTGMGGSMGNMMGAMNPMMMNPMMGGGMMGGGASPFNNNMGSHSSMMNQMQMQQQMRMGMMGGGGGGFAPGMMMGGGGGGFGSVMGPWASFQNQGYQHPQQFVPGMGYKSADGKFTPYPMHGSRSISAQNPYSPFSYGGYDPSGFPYPHPGVASSTPPPPASGEAAKKA